MAEQEITPKEQNEITELITPDLLKIGREQITQEKWIKLVMATYDCAVNGDCKAREWITLLTVKPVDGCLVCQTNVKKGRYSRVQTNSFDGREPSRLIREVVEFSKSKRGRPPKSKMDTQKGRDGMDDRCDND